MGIGHWKHLLSTKIFIILCKRAYSSVFNGQHQILTNEEETGPLNPLCAEKKNLTLQSDSDQETIEIGKHLGALLMAGDIIALVGELGSGKTWFTKGLALGLGVDGKTVVTSPSFALVNEYDGKYTLFHIDVYRLEDLSEFISAGLEEYLYSDDVVAMEWADRWPEILPEQALKVQFTIIDDQRRRIVFSGHHSRAVELMAKLKKAR